MKTTDQNHPLNEEDFSNKKEETQNKENLKEVKHDKESKPEKEISDISTQEESPIIISEEKDENPITDSDSKQSENIDFVNDDEEKLNNQVYFDDDQETDENSGKKTEESGKQKNREEEINYELLSKEDILKVFSDKLKSQDVERIRHDVEKITDSFYKKHEADLELKKERFLKEGGVLEDFKPVEDSLEREMKLLLGKYKSLKAEFNKQLEFTKKENLGTKTKILEELRILMEQQESFELTFRKFKDLQKRWFSVGIVPQQNVKDLWDSYNYFVDKFNDYVRINRELKALDLKKNLELKIQLCESAEKLDDEKNIISAFRTLQKYHTRWREIGPVSRDNRDEVWDRFKVATAAINKKHQEHHSKLKESLYENLNKKVELCEKVEAISQGEYHTHSKWIERTNELLGLQKEWKSIGYAPKKDNNVIYARFRKACDKFFSAKADFYSAAFEQQQENLKLKLKIIEQAEELKDSDDWKGTTIKLIALQKQWKEVGPVPRKESDRLWKRFRIACDHFFNKKSAYYEDIDSTYEDNLKAKGAIIIEMDGMKPSDDQKKNYKLLDEFQERFAQIGYVPNIKKDEIKDQFRDAIDRLLEKMGFSEHDRNILKFKNRIRSIMQSPRSDMKISFERDKLVNKLTQLKSDIGVWENNIGFFFESKSSQETINGFQEKIDNARSRINSLEDKIKLLDDMESKN